MPAWPQKRSKSRKGRSNDVLCSSGSLFSIFDFPSAFLLASTCVKDAVVEGSLPLGILRRLTKGGARTTLDPFHLPPDCFFAALTWPSWRHSLVAQRDSLSAVRVQMAGLAAPGNRQRLATSDGAKCDPGRARVQGTFTPETCSKEGGRKGSRETQGGSQESGPCCQRRQEGGSREHHVLLQEEIDREARPEPEWWSRSISEDKYVFVFELHEMVRICPANDDL
jgi:hypothetical protein